MRLAPITKSRSRRVIFSLSLTQGSSATIAIERAGGRREIAHPQRTFIDRTQKGRHELIETGGLPGTEQIVLQHGDIIEVPER